MTYLGKQIVGIIIVILVPYCLILWYLGAGFEVVICSLLGPFSLLPYSNHRLDLNSYLVALVLIGAFITGIFHRRTLWGHFIICLAMIVWISFGFLIHVGASL